MPPMVGVFVDPAMSYGRETYRGIMRYSKEKARWRLYLHLYPRNLPDQGFPNLDGALMAVSGPDDLAQAGAFGCPLVNLSGRLEQSPYPRFCVDDTAAGRMAAEYLLDKGYPSLGFFSTHPMDYLTSRRLEGVRGICLARTQTGPDCFLAKGERTYWERLRGWLEGRPKPFAVVAESDYDALLLQQACWESGLRVPGDVAVLGFNNDDLLCTSGNPKLSSVELPFEEIGYRAAAALDRMMQGKRDIEPETHLRPLRVVERESTDLLCVEDPALANAIRYLREHACDPCSVADVAAHAGINRRKLEIKLKELLGHSPHGELVRLRMQTARHLLETTRLSIEEVADRSGYPFTPNFNRVFKQQEGLTAGQYRRLHRRQGVPDA